MSTTDTTISEESLTSDVQQIVYDSDLREITQRSVFQQLQDKYGVSLTQFKSFIYERSVEEARMRIQTSPKLQQQAMSNSKYYPPTTMNTSKQPKYFNTIYNTPHPSYLSNQSMSNNPIKTRKRRAKITNYQDVKKHYIGNGGYNGTGTGNGNDKNHGSDSESNSGSGSGSNSDGSVRGNEPPLKRRKYGYNNLPYFNIGYNHTKVNKSAQSKRENQKDIIYEFSPAFKEIMNRNRGTWRECWSWICDYATVNDLRIGNRKIRCDDTLKKAFHREESSVTGVSRLIWKHLIGAVELDENGNFKKLVYRKRKKKVPVVVAPVSVPVPTLAVTRTRARTPRTREPVDVQDDLNNSEDDGDHEDVEEVSESAEENGQIHGESHGGNGNGGTVRKKRRYRKRLRDENGEIIKKRKKSGLTRLCFMSNELKDIVGQEYCLPRNKITKGFWDYTKVNGLKKPGRIIICDDKLKKIWGNETEQIHMFQVQKGLKAHITTMSKQEEKKYKLENPHLFNDDEDVNGNGDGGNGEIVVME